jgi:hypothetical protein
MPSARKVETGVTCAPKRPKWSISAGRHQLAQEHEEHRVADAEGGRDPGDREDVERHQEPREEQVRRLPGQGAQRGRAGDQHRRARRQERHDEKDRRRRRGRPDIGPEPSVQRRQKRDADPGGEHDRGLCHHGASFRHEHTPERSAPSQGMTSVTASARDCSGVTGMTCPIRRSSRAVRAPRGSTARQQTYSSTRDACTS